MEETLAIEEVVLRIKVLILLKIVLEKNAIHVDLNTIFPPGAHGILM